MPRLAQLQARVASMGELLNIMSAMRSLAGMRVQEAQRALPGIRRYAESMEAGIAGTLMLMQQQVPEPPGQAGRRALIVCAAEHGFVAGFNERLAEATEAELRQGDLLFVVGSRGANLLFERGRHATWTAPMATRLAAAPNTADRLAKELYARIARGQLARVEVMFSRYRQAAQPAIERRLLLPLDIAAVRKDPTRQAPLHNLEPEALLEKLAAEYVFALLTEAAVESIASENAARFAAMQAACDNVSKKLDQLQSQARHARQEEITTELIDLITGAEAMGVKGSQPG
ncbi:MAG: F0F1 ATP synthase subunit gamma [Rhodomicrobium sp.]